MKRATPETDPDRNPFRFGWRYVAQVDAAGRKQWVQTPLTLDDVLHPQEGDHIPQSTQQERDIHNLVSALRYQLADRPNMVVWADCLIDWGVPGLRNHSPDISVFEGVQDPERDRSSFAVVKEGARPVLTIEIVSPDKYDKQARDNDAVTKVEEYYRAGVPLYLLVDQERKGGPRQLVGYRRGARKYVRMRADARGRIFLAPVRLRVGLRNGRVVCWDADTDEEIGNLKAMAQARDAEAQARQQAEAEREAEAHARQQAEAEREAEAQARQQVETEREAEAEARRSAELARAAESEARQAAEAALAEARARIRALEAQTARQRGKR